MQKPVIGLIALVDEEKDSYWMLPGYMNGIIEAGGLPIVLPFAESQDDIAQTVAMCDGILFTGGHDISPKIYGQEPIAECGKLCEIRDRFEQAVLMQALKSDKAIFGICRGIQFINAALGGTLYQDLPTQHKSNVNHCQSPPYDKPIHSVKLVKDTPLYNLLKCDSFNVNSYHHQAVHELAPCLKAAAYSEDGLTEALYIPDKSYVWAVQWHPEFSYKTDNNSKMLFSSFINASKKPRVKT
ncbi:MAG: gamma-glutamyl-gamma-aminobutyrate hydrolase family protein [Ruminococcus bromii]|nr:gamma-glutamyl-gamma-aminobutyrate hydrolase family protein [Ruminococcus bromii]